MEIEIKDFLTRGIIEEAQSENGQIVSNIFCRKKKSGKVRIIGNFIHLNKNIEYKKFKQDTVKTVLDMVRPIVIWFPLISQTRITLSQFIKIVENFSDSCSTGNCINSNHYHKD